MAITYLGDAVAWKQKSPIQWDKQTVGQPDTCTIEFQGPQYLEKAFLDALTPFAAMSAGVAGLTIVDERGNSIGDSHMWFIHAASDNACIMPTVTCLFIGCRGGTIPNKLSEDGITIQSATTTHLFSAGVNDGHSVTLAIQFRSARTTYKWCQLSDPAGTATYATVRRPITLTEPPSANIVSYKYSGMVDASGEPSNSISTADATEVWNTFSSSGDRTSSFDSEEVVPAKLWVCQSVNDSVVEGT